MPVLENKYVEKFLKWVKQHHVLLLAMSVLYILRPKLVEWIKEFLCPLTPIEIDDNVWGLTSVIAAIVIAYLTHIKRLLKEREIVVSRQWTLALLFGGWCIFRYANAFKFYGIYGWVFNYIDCAWLTITSIEFGLFIYRFIQKKKRASNSEGNPFLTDAPAVKDEMNRERYAVQLIKKIKAGNDDNIIGSEEEKVDGAFTILLNESYGVGKTSFMMQLERIAKNETIDVCWFKPWLYENSRTMMINFVRILQEKLGEGDGLLQQMLNKYAQVLSSFKGYEMFSLLRFESSSVETQFEDIKSKLQEKKQPIIVLIDDVDRLQSIELLRMLQMVRNMGDFPYLYYIIAADKAALKNRLSETGISESDEYIKKFFNLEIYFPADDRQIERVFETELRHIMQRYGKKSEEISNFVYHLRYWRYVFSNIREIKRYLNILDYELANFQANNMLKDINLGDVTGVCMIKCIDSGFYQLLRDRNQYVLKEQNRRYYVNNDFSDIFTDRATKKKTDNSLMLGGTEDKDRVQEDIEKNVRSLADLVKWSKPTKTEIIGEILDNLFPSSLGSDVRMGIRYRSEYFKYFSTAYSGTEISNATIISIMDNKDDEAYQQEVQQMISEKKMESFRNKLVWYLKTREFDRLLVLRRILDTYEMECKTPSNWKEVIFLQSYGTALMEVFKPRQEETKAVEKTEWKKISDWLINSEKYEQRLSMLSILMFKVENYETYIFRSKNEVKACMEKSRKQFVSKVWAKDMFNINLYPYLSQYRSFDPLEIVTDIAAVALKIRNIDEFLYHLVVPNSGGLKWSKVFIENVIGAYSAFSQNDLIWYNTLPPKWADEFLNFKMQREISENDIAQSKFLQSAKEYWKDAQDLDENELTILSVIVGTQQATMKQFVSATGKNTATCSRYVKNLMDRGYIRPEKEGITTTYKAATKGVKAFNNHKFL